MPTGYGCLVNSSDWDALKEVLASCYRVINLGVRMLYRENGKQPLGVDLSRWAM